MSGMQMATVGIVGGLGPESTIDYYRRILEAWEREHPSTAPSIVIDSLDVQRALRLVETDRPALAEYLLASISRLAGAGVDFAVMTANTPHIVFDELAARSPVPLISIVEVCAEEARQRGLRRLALLGTRFTMEGPFYPAVCARYGIAVVPPNDVDRSWIHERYIGELLKGEFRADTRQQLISIVSRLRDEEKIDGVILGGTELPLLLPAPVIADVPALDTTALHVAAIIKRLGQPGESAGPLTPPAGPRADPPSAHDARGSTSRRAR
jgi:aspartate racemase